MAFTVHDTVRSRALRLLAEVAEPLTAQQIAGRLDTTANQTQRALRQLESAGQARRERGRGGRPFGGRTPDRWTPVD